MVVLSMALAGCTDSGAPANPNQTDDPIVDPRFDETTGAILGTALNEELSPVAGAQVGLRAAGTTETLATTTTNKDGAFGFSNIAPGSYDVLVQALGYSSQAKRAEVVVGKAVEVGFQMIAVAATDIPYSVTKGPIPGRIFCGFATGVISGPCKILGFSGALSGVEGQWQSAVGGEQNIFPFKGAISGNKTNEKDVFTELLVEIVWQETTSSSRWLSASIEDAPAVNRNLSEPLYASARGESPIRMSITAGVKNDTGNTAIPVGHGGFLVGVFPSVDPDSPREPATNRRVGASAWLDQRFDIWFTIFYNGPAEPGFTALPDM
jgi:hypothetical protein